MMDPNKLKEGMSIQEIESFAKKHRFEVFFSLAFILAAIFNFVFFSGWSLLLAAIGGIVGVAMPAFVEKVLTMILEFVLKQEKTTQIVLAAVSLVLCIFLPPLVFALLGISGGKSLIRKAEETSSKLGK
jgi:uncharacterized membrane protein